MYPLPIPVRSRPPTQPPQPTNRLHPTPPLRTPRRHTPRLQTPHLPTPRRRTP